MQLEREMAVYREKLPELVRHEGQYVLVIGEDVAGLFTSYPDALREGYRQCGLERFLVKQIRHPDPIRFITRPIHPRG